MKKGDYDNQAEPKSLNFNFNLRNKVTGGITEKRKIKRSERKNPSSTMTQNTMNGDGVSTLYCIYTF